MSDNHCFHLLDFVLNLCVELLFRLIKIELHVEGFQLDVGFKCMFLWVDEFGDCTDDSLGRNEQGV